MAVEIHPERPFGAPVPSCFSERPRSGVGDGSARIHCGPNGWRVEAVETAAGLSSHEKLERAAWISLLGADAVGALEAILPARSVFWLDPVLRFEDPSPFHGESCPISMGFGGIADSPPLPPEEAWRRILMAGALLRNLGGLALPSVGRLAKTYSFHAPGDVSDEASESRDQTILCRVEGGGGRISSMPVFAGDGGDRLSLEAAGACALILLDVFAGGTPPERVLRSAPRRSGFHRRRDARRRKAEGAGQDAPLRSAPPEPAEDLLLVVEAALASIQDPKSKTKAPGTKP